MLQFLIQPIKIKLNFYQKTKTLCLNWILKIFWNPQLIVWFKDQKLLNSLQAFLDKQKKGTGKSNDFGINFFSDVIFFGEKNHIGQFNVLLVNLINEDKFSKNLPFFLDDNQSFSIKNNVGIIATYFGKKTIDKSKIDSYIATLKINKNNKHAKQNKNELINVSLTNYEINDLFIISKGQINSEIDDKEMKLKGEIKIKQKMLNPLKWTLIEDYNLRPFHLEASFVSKSIKDSIHNYLTTFGINIPNFNAFALNYYGIEIQETELGLIFSPKFDLILNFKDSISKELIFKDKEKLLKLGFDYRKNYIKAGNLEYSIDLLDNKTLFLGSNKNLVRSNKKSILLKISGDIGKLTEIKGGGFIKSIINVIPSFKAAKDFFSSIQEFKIAITPKKDNLLFVRGNIKL